MNKVSILFYNFIEFIILLYTFLVYSFARYNKYTICIVSFRIFSDVFPGNIRLDEDVLKTRFAFVFTRRLQDVLVKTNIFVLVIRVRYIFKKFSGHLQGVFKASCQDIFKMKASWSSQIKTIIFGLVIPLQKASSWRLGQDQYVRFGYTSLWRLQDLFQISSRCLQDVLPRHIQDVCKMSSRHLSKTSSRCL